MSLFELIGVQVGLVFVAAAASYVACWLVLAGLRRWSVMDVPNARSSHSQPTPRGGGIGIMVTFVVGAVWLAPSGGGGDAEMVAALVGALAVLSFLDDKLDLSWRLRLGGHLLAAVVGAVWFRPELGAWSWVLVPVLVLLLAGHGNAFNFMDGVNGIAMAQTVIAGLGLACLAGGQEGDETVATLALLLAGAAAGFGPHNFPRARMFMGDVGSVPLGVGLMLLSAWLARDRGLATWVPLLAIHSGFVLDTGFTLLRRWRRGDRLHEAHREHFYQRLVRAGWSHVAVTSSFAAASATVGVGAVALHGLQVAPAWTLLLLVGVWGAYFSVAERVFRRSAAR